MGVLIEKAQSLWFLAKTVGWSAEQPHVILPESVCHKVQLSNLEEINACMAVPRFCFL